MSVIRAEPGQVFFEKQFIINQLLENKTPQEIWGLSDERVEKMYQFACDLYDEKRYKDAANLFMLLTTLNPHRFTFWKALGFSIQQQCDYAPALLAYECALELDPGSAELYPYYIRCLCELNRREQALVLLQEIQDKNFNESPGELERIRTQCEIIVKASLDKLKGG